MVLWKGIDFKDKGIIVEYTPKISKGKKKITTYEIDGRNGFVSVDTGTYESFVVSVECHFDYSIAKEDVIKSFLDGYGTLSFDGSREYTAIIQNSIEFSKVLKFRKFVVQFLVNPIAEDIEETTVNITASPTILTITDATEKMYPTLEITGSDDVSIAFNNETFNLKSMDGTFILDCKNKVVTCNDLNVANQMQYDFPHLNPGENTISYIGTITSFVIKYKKAYL